MASDNMKDNFLYLVQVASCDLQPYIKQSSIGNVPVETITTSVALIWLETPEYKHRTQGCVLAGAKRYQTYQEDGSFYYELQSLLELPVSWENVSSSGHCVCVNMYL